MSTHTHTHACAHTHPYIHAYICTQSTFSLVAVAYLNHQNTMFEFWCAVSFCLTSNQFFRPASCGCPSGSDDTIPYSLNLSDCDKKYYLHVINSAFPLTQDIPTNKSTGHMLFYIYIFVYMRSYIYKQIFKQSVEIQNI